MEWKEVTKDEFWKAVGSLNVHPYPEGKYPYTSYFKFPDGSVFGKKVGYFPGGIETAFPEARYYLRLRLGP